MKKTLNTETKPESCLASVSGSAVTPYWVICVNSYKYEDTYIPKGRMHKHYSERPIQNKDWRRATQDEIDTKDWFKGNFFNLKNV